MRTPRSVDVEITSRCNLRCSYCYFFDNPETRYTDLPTESWLRFFEELGRAAVMDVCLLGGEPFIRSDLPRLIEGIVVNRMRFSILSNGTLISDEIASFIRSTNRCNFVQVSIDGSNAQAHDSCRGEGSFARAVNGIRILQENDVPVTVRVTLHRHNIDDLDNIAGLLLEDLQLQAFTTNAAGYLGSCRNNREILLSTGDREKAMNSLVRLSRKYEGRITAQAGPLAEAGMWSRMEEARRLGEESFEDGGYLTGCGCPWSALAVRSDGTFVPCLFLSHMQLGRMQTIPLEAVWREHQLLEELRRRSETPLSSFSYCRNCEYIPYCTGNCPGISYGLTGNTNHPSPDGCLRRYLESGGSLV